MKSIPREKSMSIVKKKGFKKDQKAVKITRYI